MVISFMLPGIGCIFPFLPLHMRKVGLTAIESQTVSAVAPLGKISFHSVMLAFVKYVFIVTNYSLFQHILDVIKFFSCFLFKCSPLEYI